ncbi:unnamed protein product [Didymodactylos carnosus]|uniref:Uncharacterized protein n=1 Tax=Didymodactylos carnosus TaxID=1234261 RepID=A0A814QRE4_9BILA|nr:unnamed protein product [Didymodactylos carnosus]CAF1123266.1 unnamed protein product [Didymodactylos carnosus]CAF3641104.1 unnamed protein product [Didymodactylos carnosus]CAF3886783.1 unnamed protein product [Didymodactylos carnosus]
MSSHSTKTDLSSINLVQHRRGPKSLLKPIEQVIELINQQMVMGIIRECLKDESLKNDINEIVIQNNGSVDKSSESLGQLLLKPILDTVNDQLHTINIQLQKQQQDQRNIEAKLDDIERRSRSYNLRFYGIKEDEHIKKQIVNIASLLNISLSVYDIEAAHRLGPRQSGMHRGVIARFYSREVRYALLASRKLIKQPNGRKFYILEDCTSKTVSLYNSVRAKLDDNCKHHVYIRNGHVLYKTKKEDKPTLISTAEDIDTIFHTILSDHSDSIILNYTQPTG